MPISQPSILARDFKLNTPRAFYFVIFTVSGFSGLIYESIWSHYLKLFLGHAAYAQSLVLMIFMGGMAIGSWIASRFSVRSRSPLLIYAAVELVVGIAALVFHNVFTGVIDVFYNSILPSIGLPFAGATLKWLAASILIMPQSVLLGMTFPIMSAGIIRRFPDARGGSIAMLYFTNSIGAAMGVLASGFWLIKLTGLPGTIVAAGLLNIALAIAVFIVVRLDPVAETAPIKSEATSGGDEHLKLIFLIAAFITGAASFMYEISWIRMLSLVLGATTHSFELMLSAFITGLAFGGLWIKKRVDRISSPIRFSGYVQIIMGLLALLTIPVFMATFGWMEWLLSSLQRTDSGYIGFHLASHAISLAVMLPATFMAGMTLPLFTFVLLRNGFGEASIGQIYAANTVGAIVGVLVAVHIGLPFLGMKGLISLAALLDVSLGLFLLARHRLRSERPMELAVASALGVSVFAATLAIIDIEPNRIISGVYRTGISAMLDSSKVLFYQDGKTATVSLQATSTGHVVLKTNGKPDASIQFNPDVPMSRDEVTMVIAGALPLAYMPDAKNIANIGMGSGMTTHTLLAHKGVTNVDTIEIEPAMVAAAAGFGEFVERAFSDTRSKIHIEDAKTYFSLHNSVYDIIVAEPSNPWVSGVASLFSQEFYSTVRRHLVDDGLFVQWIQLYEFNDLLAESILKALTETFSDYVIYSTDGINILVVAKNHGSLGEPDWSVIFEDEMKSELAEVSVLSETDMQIRRVVDRSVLYPYLKLSIAPVNSDYFPFVDLNAGRARFKGSTSELFGEWMIPPLPVFEMLSNEQIDFDNLTSVYLAPRTRQAEKARYIADRLTGDVPPISVNDTDLQLPTLLHYLTELLRNEMNSCNSESSWPSFPFVMQDIMANALSFMTTDRGVKLLDTLKASSCGQHDEYARAWIDFYYAVARRDGLEMSARANYLLSAQTDETAAFNEYLVGAAMLGDIAAGDGQMALDFWNNTGKDLLAGAPLDSYTQLIVSIALDSEPPEQSVTRSASR